MYHGLLLSNQSLKARAKMADIVNKVYLEEITTTTCFIHQFRRFKGRHDPLAPASSASFHSIVKQFETVLLIV